jgi:hypothetical protein
VPLIALIILVSAVFNAISLSYSEVPINVLILPLRNKAFKLAYFFEAFASAIF